MESIQRTRDKVTKNHNDKEEHILSLRLSLILLKGTVKGGLNRLPSRSPHCRRYHRSHLVVLQEGQRFECENCDRKQ